MAAAEPLESSQIVIDRPDAEVVEFKQRISPEVEKASSISIIDDAGYQHAAEFLRSCKSMQKEIEGALAQSIEHAHKAHKSLTTLRADTLAPLKEAEQLVKSKMGNYVEAEERRAAEEKRRAEEEARKAQEEENLRRAAQLEAEGRQEEAEQAVDAPISTPVIKAPPAPRAAGTSTRKKYSVEVNDLDALVRAVAEGKAPKGLVIANQKVLDAMAKSLKGDFDVPGCELKTGTVVSAGGR